MIDIGRLTEAERDELETRGKLFDLSAAEVAAADALRMPLERYRAFKGRRSIDDLREVDRMLGRGGQGARGC